MPHFSGPHTVNLKFESLQMAICTFSWSPHNNKCVGPHSARVRNYLILMSVFDDQQKHIKMPRKIFQSPL